ncbi:MULTISPECIES: hypothetical protein [unclassified Nostoc]|uniref:hypothetical protein n=1 Tax=unclassified Nostoc TaxID=2593658 RepID=UPI0025E213DC|nr:MULTISPECIES: hypothetical protein [unclassified Nostoc]MBN3990745.1 hypothetical protein [Nostoc sp. NMS2]
MKILDRIFAINHHKDAINRRLYNNQSFVLTAIYRVSCFNYTNKTRLRGLKNLNFL